MDERHFVLLRSGQHIVISNWNSLPRHSKHAMSAHSSWTSFEKHCRIYVYVPKTHTHTHTHNQRTYSRFLVRIWRRRASRELKKKLRPDFIWRKKKCHTNVQVQIEVEWKEENNTNSHIKWKTHIIYTFNMEKFSSVSLLCLLFSFTFHW